MDPAATTSSRPLTIGIDARAATEVLAGRGRVVRELLRALSVRHDGHRYICLARERWDEPLGEGFTWHLIGLGDPWWHVAVAALAGRRCDAFLSTNSYLTAALTRAPSVTIVYDLLALDPATSPNRRSAVIERLTLGAGIRRSRGLICISQATADALVSRFPCAQDRITIAPLAASGTLASPTGDELDTLPAPGFVLAVGTLEPRKNLPRLVSAYASLPTALQAAHPLVVVGATGWRSGPTLSALRSLGDRCRVLGYVSDEALAELYRRCALFCYPSLGEGFGLPVLEAMSAGAAVLTSDLSSLTEVGGDAVAYIDPRHVPDIARGLAELLGDPQRRARLSERARARAREFSWSAFAEATVTALQRAQRRTAS